MFTRDIKCTYCGVSGKIEIPGFDDFPDDTNVFKHVGHNPYSCHLHYECPECHIVLLVDPIEPLGREKYVDSPSEVCGRSVCQEYASGNPSFYRISELTRLLN